MRYLVDGYNYLFAVGLLQQRRSPRAGPHELQRARLQLVGPLAAAFPAGTVTVVFDAANAIAGASPTDEDGPVRVLFETSREADDLLEDLIHQDSGPKTLTVVSDDRRVRDVATRKGCGLMHCEEFAQEMTRARQAQSARDLPEKPDELSAGEIDEWSRRFGC